MKVLRLGCYVAQIAHALGVNMHVLQSLLHSYQCYVPLESDDNLLLVTVQSPIHPD